MSPTHFINDLLQSKHVYAYYIPKLDVIKVGFGDNAKDRMLNYCRFYGLTPDSSSLRSWPMPAAALASTIETAIHRGLQQSGFPRHLLETQNGIAQELFRLSGTPCDEAFLYISEIIDLVSQELATRIQYNNTEVEKTRQKQKQFIQKKLAIKQKAELEKEAHKNEQQLHLDKEWSAGWESYIKPCAIAMEAAEKIYLSYKPSYMSKLFGGDTFSHFMKSHQYQLMLDLLPEAFLELRRARAFIAYIARKYQGFQPTDWDIFTPFAKKRQQCKFSYRYIHSMPITFWYDGEGFRLCATENLVEAEIMDLILAVFGVGSGNASIIIATGNIKIMEVRRLAQASPMPEIAILRIGMPTP